MDAALLQHFVHNRANLRLCIDGGRRSCGKGALGMVLYGVSIDDSGNTIFTPVMRQGLPLEIVASAFMAESLALEWALNELVDIIRGNFNFA